MPARPTLLEHIQEALTSDTPRDSRQKLAAVIDAIAVYRPRGGVEAGLSLVLRPLLGQVALPDDPAHIDALLQGAAEQLRQVLADLQSDPGTAGVAPELRAGDEVFDANAEDVPEPEAAA